MLQSKFNSISRVLIVALVTLSSSLAPLFGQQNESLEASEEIMTAVFQDVWLPFMESYRELDVEKFQSIHSKDLTRVSISRNQIQSYSDYFTEMTGFFQQIKKSGRQMDIQFSMISTTAGHDKTYQTGYYCFRSRSSSSEEFQPRGYGFFNVLLTKQDGIWEISLDSDNRANITEEEFNEAGTIYGLN